MQQHLIAIDLDGTTLNDRSQLTPLTIKTLRTLSAMGHMVSIITGRPFRNTIGIYQQLNIQSPMATFNGAYCAFPGKDAWLPTYHYELDREIALDLFARQEELNIDLLCAEGLHRLYTTSTNLPDSPFYPKDEAEYTKLSRDSLTQNPTAITIFSAREQQEVIRRQVLEEYQGDVEVRTWGGDFPVLEVVQAGVHKAKAVQAIADFYHIPQKNIFAFGDEDNDHEMIEYAGRGVAMKNCIPSILEVADDQTQYTNDEEGLARYLIKHFDLSVEL